MLADVISMAVGSTTQFSEAWNSLYNLLTGSSGVNDPANRGINRGDWVMAAFPDITRSDFPGYPILIIQSPNIRNSELTYSFRKSSITFVITILANRAEYIDSVSDNVMNIILSQSTATEANGLYKPEIVDSTTDVVFRDKKKIHIKNLFVNYEWVGAF